MKKSLAFFILWSCLAACVPTSTPVPTPQVVKVYATAAAQPWQTKLYDCAASQSVVLALSAPETADLTLRLGEPDKLNTPAFQVDSEEVLVVVNQANPSNQLTASQITDFFTGRSTDWEQIEPAKTGAVQVWVFAEGEDVQQVFAKTLPGNIVSTARLATSPDEMSSAIAADPNAIGFLPRHWAKNNTREVYVVATVPVLASTQSEPQGALKALLACLQQKTAP